MVYYKERIEVNISQGKCPGRLANVELSLLSLSAVTDGVPLLIVLCGTAQSQWNCTGLAGHDLRVVVSVLIRQKGVILQ